MSSFRHIYFFSFFSLSLLPFHTYSSLNISTEIFFKILSHTRDSLIEPSHRGGNAVVGLTSENRESIGRPISRERRDKEEEEGEERKGGVKDADTRRRVNAFRDDG